MTITEMDDAISQAKAELRRADMVATSLARMLVDRLRQVDSGYILAELKRELRAFNIQTKTWTK